MPGLYISGEVQYLGGLGFGHILDGLIDAFGDVHRDFFIVNYYRSIQPIAAGGDKPKATRRSFPPSIRPSGSWILEHVQAHHGTLRFVFLR